jgi:glycolate oxidase
MLLSREIYRQFEDVVGVENICDDPAIMPSYFNTKFAAVVLPKNTPEVLAIVKLCNKYKLKFRPICTGWGGMFSEGMILIDLRRMNHVIEINEENMYAVVEPYVISAELQAEVFKRGLNFSIKGSGANCTAMLRGHGHMDESTSADDRNHLAVEWVTPEGELVKLGALGSQDEWFCGDGPGPSLRSLITSVVPPGVTPGVITKAAVKLYHWPGPAAYPVIGKSPRYVLKEVPANMMARYFSFPSVDKSWQAELKIGEAEIALELMGFNAAMVACNVTTSNEEEEEVFKKISREVQGPGFFVIIAGNSPEDFVYKKRVLETIVANNGGKSLKMIEDPEIEGMIMAHCTRISASIREVFRAAGFGHGIPVMGQRDLIIKWAIGAGKAKKELIDRGLVVDDGGALFGWGVENGHLGKTELTCKFEFTNKEAEKAVVGWLEEQSARAYNEHYFANFYLEGQAEKVGPGLSNYDVWWKKAKNAIDPNSLTDVGGALL